jgi:hypothetical protein
MRWSRLCRSNQLNHTTRRTSSAGALPPAPGTHPVVAVVSEPFLAKSPQFNHLSRQSHLSMRWSRRCRSNQLNHATRRTPVLGDSHCPRDPSSGGLLKVFWPQIPPIQSFWSSKAISMRWSRRCNQINSIMPRRTSSTGRLPTCPRDPIRGGSGALWYFGPNTPKFNHFGSSRAISMRWSRRCRSNQLNHTTRRTSLGRLPPAPGPINGGEWSRNEPIL